MFNVICVLRSGKVYNPEWVRKLRDGVARNLTIPHRFRCLSDVDVPCERIPLETDWPAWWAKIELFKEGVIDGRTLYLDLDTVITGNIDHFSHIEDDFVMLQNFHEPLMVGSGLMLFNKVPHEVYERFVINPEGWIEFHEENKIGPYIGDQAFIGDTLHWEIDKFGEIGVKSYKYHCKDGLPKDARIVCFHGKPRPNEVKSAWMQEHWR